MSVATQTRADVVQVTAPPPAAVPPPAAAPAPSPRYRAFVSYCHRDDKVARWLHREIETYRVPRAIVGHETPHGVVPRRLGKVFRDEEELGGAAELGPQLEAALRDSAALIAICSVNAAKSKWVCREIQVFKHLNPDRPVLAVIADGVPFSADAECFPESLKYGVTPDGEIDFAHPGEPLAPDLQKLDRDAVKMKLIAGLLGVGYDELARRDIRRERRRMALFGTLGAVLLTVLAALSIAAFTYARVAVEQRERAEAAQALAEKNAEEADRKAWLAQTAAEQLRKLLGDPGVPSTP